MRFFIILFVLSGAAHARCAAESTHFYPKPGGTLVARPLIIVTGFGGQQGTIRGLKGAALRSGSHVVRLESVTTNEGALRLTQRLFRATEDLKAGQLYTLELVGKTKTWKPKHWVKGTRVRVKWTAADGSPQTPAWTGPMKHGTWDRRELGCGPSVNYKVALPATGAAFVEVTLRGASESRTYVLNAPDDGPLRIGHGMCSGAFDVKSWAPFSAKLVLMDSQGNPFPESREIEFSVAR